MKKGFLSVFVPQEYIIQLTAKMVKVFLDVYKRQTLSITSETSIRKADDGRKFESSTRHKRFWLYGDSVISCNNVLREITGSAIAKLL